MGWLDFTGALGKSAFAQHCRILGGHKSLLQIPQRLIFFA
jgi:hypothetical protein